MSKERGGALVPRSQMVDAVVRPVTLQQSLFWSRAILWSLMGVTVASIAGACLAKIDEAVPVTGKLEPPESVKEIKAPLGGGWCNRCMCGRGKRWKLGHCS